MDYILCDGKRVKTSRLLEDIGSWNEKQFTLIKRRIQKKEISYRCIMCNNSLSLKCGPILIPHFSHAKNTAKYCPLKTKEDTDFFNRAIKYDGAKESKMHLEIKNHVFSMISKNSKFKDTLKEKNLNSELLKSMLGRKKFRRPDVRSTFASNDKKIAFEIQLQTMSLKDVVDREDFYNCEGVYLMYFFDRTNLRVSENNIFFGENANENAYIIDSETMELSIQKSILCFKCEYKKPYLTEDFRIVEDEYVTELVNIDDITFEKDGRMYFFDVSRRRKTLEHIKNNFDICIAKNNYYYISPKKMTRSYFMEKYKISHDDLFHGSKRYLIEYLINLLDFL